MKKKFPQDLLRLENSIQRDLRCFFPSQCIQL